MKTNTYQYYPLSCYVRVNLILICLLPLFGGGFTYSQDIESIGSNLRNWKKSQLDVGGGINLNTTFYTSNSIDPRRDPFTWSVMANMNLGLMGINAPFSFIFSDGNQRFNLPSYTYTGISPKYKWATLHAGDRNMYFNRYTLSNLNFRGGGLELTPGKWTIKTMYGRLQKANAEDLNTRQSINPAYERRGWGVLAGYAGNDYSVTAALFKAFDKANSISSPINYDISPSDNMVFSLSGRKAFGKQFVLDADVARSAFNKDIRAGNEEDELTGLKYTYFGLFQPTASASFGNAYNIGLTYTQPLFSLRLGTEKIDRNFQSLGSLFFNNDLRHYTASFNTSLLKRKVTLGLRGGLELTNLEDNVKPKNDRVVAAIMLGYQASDRLMFNANYSNFDNTTKIRVNEDPGVFVDSLFLAQTTQSAGLSSSYRFGDKSNPSSLFFSYSHQNAKSILNDVVIEDAKSSFDNFNLGFNKRIKAADLVFNASINYNISNLTISETKSFAPAISINKSFFERKLRSSLRSSYSLVSSDINPSSQVLNIGWSNSMAILKNQRVVLQLNYVNRSGGNPTSGEFNELYGSIRYAYQFTKSITGKRNK